MQNNAIQNLNQHSPDTMDTVHQLDSVLNTLILMFLGVEF